MSLVTPPKLEAAVPGTSELRSTFRVSFQLCGPLATSIIAYISS